MKEIAALSGVSVATVSHVLSGKKSVSPSTRERVLQSIGLTNYKLNTIAKSLRMNKTHIIGVLVEDICGLPVPEIVDGINQCLEESGYQVLLSNLRLLQKLYNQYEQLSQYTGIVNRGLQLLEDARVDGIIYVAMHDRRIDGIHQPVSIPLVYAYAESGDPANVSVTYDNENSAYEMTRLLIRQNHRQVALIAGHANTSAANRRLTGYRQAMDEAGLPVPPEYIRWGDWEYHSGVEQAGALLALALPPTAIFAMNDPMAAGCYAAIKRSGLRIPEDISVVGFDNREIASCLFPGLTTVALPNKEIGHTAAQQLLQRLDGLTIATPRTTLPCRIIRRDSTLPR
ncbi:MAG: LacI family transcriptional regulator [Oscillospiraceae bacterium]|jgi:LacI family transcriptional regulator|nr:LacI family transcriptional regulator [Oscillospiraceae bacterium]